MHRRAGIAGLPSGGPSLILSHRFPSSIACRIPLRRILYPCRRRDPDLLRDLPLMITHPELHFAPLTAALAPTVVILVGPELALGTMGERLDQQSLGALRRAMTAADFKGKARSSIEVLGPPNVAAKRIILLGTGARGDAKDQDWTRLGGAAMAQITARATDAASILVELGEDHGIIARLAEGMLLRSYKFKKYHTRQSEDGNGNGSNGSGREKPEPRLTIHSGDPEAVDRAFLRHKAVASGVHFARDLVNEPANVLGPVEFADRLSALSIPGLEVEVLGMDELRSHKMGALLAVGQGSQRESRVVVMQWNGAKRARNRQPVCFIGKGVCFDTGGISMKPAAGMEDMKGDMGGAACVSGLMLALAERKANVNAVGIVGLVENMPSGTATRPGDIVTSMSGQTIEILNTDAEGRLVLADIMWYVQERFKPRLMVDLATLTGAIMVALGKERAGLFSNNDKLAREIEEAGDATGEKVWRMPLDPAYDKLLESKNADMKNIGGRFGGAITAAQFLQRFVKDGATPWAHLDIAGTAMDSGRNEINQSWASGWGVRMLEQMVHAGYE
jgi:leucyl aminopeptidase